MKQALYQSISEPCREAAIAGFTGTVWVLFTDKDFTLNDHRYTLDHHVGFIQQVRFIDGTLQQGINLSASVDRSSTDWRYLV